MGSMNDYCKICFKPVDVGYSACSTKCANILRKNWKTFVKVASAANRAGKVKRILTRRRKSVK